MSKAKNAPPPLPTPFIRWMIRRDMPEVLAIERASFDFPWTEEDFYKCLRHRSCIGLVTDFRESVLAYALYDLHHKRFQLLNIAVHPDHRGKGYGRQMMQKLIGKLSEQRRTRITLEVRERNVAAQLFFKRMGFRAVSIIRDLYQDTDEDAILMQYRFGGIPAAYTPKNRLTEYFGECAGK